MIFEGEKKVFDIKCVSICLLLLLDFFHDNITSAVY